MSTQYNARIEWQKRADVESFDWVDALMDALADWHPAVGSSVRGFVEATITLPADTVRQATSAAALIAQDAAGAAGGETIALEVMPTAEFDARAGLAPWPEMLSVTQAAERLGVSAQAVRQRLESGSLAGTKVGATWVVSGSQAALAAA